MSNVCKALLNFEGIGLTFYSAKATLQAYHSRMNEIITNPTLDTLLERMNTLAEQLNVLAERMDKGFAAINVRLDRIESLAYTTRGEMLSMRADFTEMQHEFREVRGGLKQPA